MSKKTEGSYIGLRYTGMDGEEIVDREGEGVVRREYRVEEYGAKADGITLCTKAIQAAIDEAARDGGKVVLGEGTYLSGSLFLKSGIEFYLSEGAVLLGVQDEAEYPFVPSRVAGVEMEWPAGLLNVMNQVDVVISGPGTIDGQGEYWWKKYWGDDRKGGMRGVYEPQGLRWAVDYDCTRPRNIIVIHSENIELKDFTCLRSGFWNIHLCYSRRVHVDGVQVGENGGPSTDGIDIDSCDGVLIENAVISCNDDSICVKSGRDADGLRVNRVCENVTIQNCKLYAGAGITLGSETSGGIRNIHIRNNYYEGTDNGFRIKSARTRGGVIENIKVENLQMVNVKNTFSFLLDWNPTYSYCALPEGYTGEVSERWKKLMERVPLEKGIPLVKNIQIKNVKSVYTEEYEGKSNAFEIEALEGFPIEEVHFNQVEITAKTFGRIKGVKGWKLDNVALTIE